MLEVIINNKKYSYKGDLNITVTELLDKLNIEYSCSCLQGLCGACAMVINGTPKLACKTLIQDETYTKTFKKIKIEPLSKFPQIKDLKVDRTKLYKSLEESEIYLKSKSKINKDNALEYEMSQCIMCGCCVEACPNYNNEEFAGTPLAVNLSKINLEEQDKEHIKELKKNYEKHFFKHCVKSLACEDICPMKIKTQRAISLLNKTSVWRIRDLFNR